MSPKEQRLLTQPDAQMSKEWGWSIRLMNWGRTCKTSLDTGLWVTSGSMTTSPPFLGNRSEWWLISVVNLIDVRSAVSLVKQTSVMKKEEEEEEDEEGGEEGGRGGGWRRRGRKKEEKGISREAKGWGRPILNSVVGSAGVGKSNEMTA